MSQQTKIQWCDSTVNPVMGCGGCELWTSGNHTCYAGRLHQLRKSNSGFASQFERPQLFPGRMAQAACWPELTGMNRPDKPWLSGLPRIIFVSDMGDALTERGFVDAEGQPLDERLLFPFLKREVIDVADSALGQQHQWLWLTKRPQRLAQFVSSCCQNIQLPDNLWLGTSVTSRSSLKRLAQLTQIGHDRTIRFVSVEPLWEEVSLAPFLDDLHWVIIGGESGFRSKSRLFDCRWAGRLIKECRAAGVPVFIKQLGANVFHRGQNLFLADSQHGGDWSEWPRELQIRQMPVGRIHVPATLNSSEGVCGSSNDDPLP